jgi:hypothetical protein
MIAIEFRVVDVSGADDEEALLRVLAIVQVDQTLVRRIEGAARSERINGRRPRCGSAPIPRVSGGHCHGEHAASRGRLDLGSTCRVCSDRAVEVRVVLAVGRQNLHRLERMSKLHL